MESFVDIGHLVLSSSSSINSLPCVHFSQKTPLLLYKPRTPNHHLFEVTMNVWLSNLGEQHLSLSVASMVRWKCAHIFQEPKRQGHTVTNATCFARVSGSETVNGVLIMHTVALSRRRSPTPRRYHGTISVRDSASKRSPFRSTQWMCLSCRGRHERVFVYWVMFISVILSDKGTQT